MPNVCEVSIEQAREAELIRGLPRMLLCPRSRSRGSLVKADQLRVVLGLDL